MSDHHIPKLRQGNKALDYLVTRYQPMDGKLRTLIDLFPKFGDGLYLDAQAAARDLLHNNTPNPLMRVARRLAALGSSSRSTREIALANSIFDLQLTVFFTKVSKFVGDNEIASLLVDALVYQATGCEARSPSQDELLSLGTQDARGIHKFQLAHKIMPHIGDIEAWMFGKEFGAIVYESPMDIAYILSVSPFTLVARVRARWHIKYLLYGTPPTKQDEEALEVVLKKQKQDLQKMIDAFPKTKDA